MIKRLFFITIAVASLALVASGAMAQGVGNHMNYGDNAVFVSEESSGSSAFTVLNPEGQGDVLIFPYYDVREITNGSGQSIAQTTLFAIINNDDECTTIFQTGGNRCGMAAKLRFREWDKSIEVFDVDIWLSKADVWVGQLIHDTTIALPYGTRIISPDWVIVANDGNTFTLSQALASPGVLFPTTAFIPTNPNNGAQSNNLYGYFEVIGEEMTFDKAFDSTGKAIIPNNDGTGFTSPYKVTRDLSDARNQLMGFADIIRVQDGVSTAYNATALANFARNKGTLFSGPGSTAPSLLDAEDTLDELEFQLSKEDVEAAYDVETALNARFSLILTFPTKHFHFCNRGGFTAKTNGNTACTNTLPLKPPFSATAANNPEPVDIFIYDRNESVFQVLGGFISPLQSSGLPYEVNIIGLYKGTNPSVPAAGIRDNLTISTQGFESGWIRIVFTGSHATIPQGFTNSITAATFTRFQNLGVFYRSYEGLPALGLQLQEFSNGPAGGFYGDIRPIWYEIEWNFNNIILL